jgi:ubiquitin-conjugating enzyme E2 D/E
MGTKGIQRIFQELKAFEKHSELKDRIKIFPNKNNFNFWKIFLFGPKSSFYEDGIYLISCKFPKDYPKRPPTMRFVTPIYHCNISFSGIICLEILRHRNWKKEYNIS